MAENDSNLNFSGLSGTDLWPPETHKPIACIVNHLM